MLTAADIKDCMACEEHLAGEKCGPERILSDKIVIARQAHDCCHICRGSIEPRTHNRVSKIIWDGEFLTARICETCCEAQAAWTRGDDEPLMDRYELGNERVNGPLQ